MALGACRCGDESVIAVFTDVKYTSDGSALLLHATDGVYVARPPNATPRLAVDKTCSLSKTHSLDCVRASKDGTRLAVLAVENDLPVLYDVRPKPFATDASTLSTLVDVNVLDAFVGQDGKDLAYSRPSIVPGAIDVFHVDANGVSNEIVHELPLGVDEAATVASALVVTPYGVAYPRPTADGVDARFRAWGQEGIVLGALDGRCAGAAFPYCVVTNADGSAVAWQDPVSGIIHAYRPLSDLDLPLGVGYDFAFSRGGSTVLRLAYGPYAALVQRADTAVVLRSFGGAVAADLSADGETLAWVEVESKVNKTWKLRAGAARRAGQDLDLGVFDQPGSRPLLSTSRGDAPLGFSLTGDARFVVLDTPPLQPGTGTRIVSVNTSTGEPRTLDTLTCAGCCLVAPAGSLVACIPAMAGGSITEPAALDLYDPATGTRTRASEKAILVAPFSDGSGAAVMEYQGDVPELFLVFKDGRRESKGLSLRVAASPDQRQYAWLDEIGHLSVDSLP